MLLRFLPSLSKPHLVRRTRLTPFTIRLSSTIIMSDPKKTFIDKVLSIQPGLAGENDEDKKKFEGLNDEVKGMVKDLKVRFVCRFLLIFVKYHTGSVWFGRCEKDIWERCSLS